jgi:hypothetical protein
MMSYQKAHNGEDVMKRLSYCMFCRRPAECTFAFELRDHGEKVPVVVCEECILHFRYRLQVLGRDFRFVAQPPDTSKE